MKPNSNEAHRLQPVSPEKITPDTALNTTTPKEGKGVRG
jgi:hypothetical protein